MGGAIAYDGVGPGGSILRIGIIDLAIEGPATALFFRVRESELL